MEDSIRGLIRTWEYDIRAHKEVRIFKNIFNELRELYNAMENERSKKEMTEQQVADRKRELHDQVEMLMRQKQEPWEATKMELLTTLEKLREEVLELKVENSILRKRLGED